MKTYQLPKTLLIINLILFSISFIVFLFGAIEGSKTVITHLWGQKIDGLVVADVKDDYIEYLEIKYTIDDQVYYGKIQNSNEKYNINDTVEIYVAPFNNEYFVIFPRNILLTSIPFIIGLFLLTIYSLKLFKLIKNERLYKKLYTSNKTITGIITDIKENESKTFFGITPFIVTCVYNKNEYKSHLIYKSFDNPLSIINYNIKIYYDKANYFIDIDSIEKNVY